MRVVFLALALVAFASAACPIGTESGIAGGPCVAVNCQAQDACAADKVCTPQDIQCARAPCVKFTCEDLTVDCPDDVFECPDRSFVNREGPKCEFAACPKAPTDPTAPPTANPECTSDSECPGVCNVCANGQCFTTPGAFMCDADDLTNCGDGATCDTTVCGGRCVAKEGPTPTPAVQDPEPECNNICPAVVEPVCGSDGTTYNNVCEFTNAKCVSGKDVTFTEGACKPDTTVDCTLVKCGRTVCADGSVPKILVAADEANGKCCAVFDKCPTVAEEEFDCMTKEVWTKEKVAWCCAEKKICPADPIDEDEYNCFTREVWTEEKIAWCCAEKKIGCVNDGPCAGVDAVLVEERCVAQKLTFDADTCQCSKSACNTAAINCDATFNWATCSCPAVNDPKPCEAAKPMECDGKFDFENCVCMPFEGLELCPDSRSLSVVQARKDCAIAQGIFIAATCKCLPVEMMEERPCANGDNYEDAKKKCAGYAVGTQFFNSATCACEDRIEGLDSDCMVEKKACSGYTAFPQTHDWNPRTCECVEKEKDEVSLRNDCAMFPTCSQDVPCLTSEGKCVPKQGEECSAKTKECTSFGRGGGEGTVCPNGLSFTAVQTMCENKDGARMSKIGCDCAVPVRKCPNGEIYAAAAEKCKAAMAEGHNVEFDFETCECKAKDTCEERAMSYDAAKADCSKPGFEMAPNTCKCIQVDVKDYECGDFKTYADAKAACYAKGEDKVVWNADECKCVETSPTLPPVAVTLFEVEFTVSITGASKDEIMSSVTRLMKAYHERMSQQFNGATMELKEFKSMDDKSELVVLVRTYDEAQAVAIKEWAENFADEATTQALFADVLGKEAVVSVESQEIVEVDDVIEDGAMTTGPTLLVVLASALLAFMRV